MQHTATSTTSPATQRSGVSRTAVLWAVIFCVWFVIYVPGLFRPGLLDDADSTHAEAAREMFETGDYVTLHVNGVRYLEKAPLPYWLVASSYAAFGISEFSTRLPRVLTILLTILLAGVWASRAFGRRAGLYAGLFVSTAVGYFLFTRIFIPDALLALLTAAPLYFFLTALEPGRHTLWRWYAGYASVALAVLTKGFVALIFVGLIAVFYLALTGEWRRWKEFHLPTGVALMFVIGAPWHILAGLRNPGFFWFYFINEHVLRFLGMRYPKDYNKLPALAYWGLHLVWLFPWSIYFPLAFRDLRRDFSVVYGAKGRGGVAFGERTRLLCWIWAGVVILFFAFSTNQEYYTLPAYLPLLILLAASLVKEQENKPASRWIVWAKGFYLAMGLAAGGVLVAALWASRKLPYVADIGSLLDERNVAQNTLSMSHFFDLTTASFAALRLPAGLAAAALLLGPALVFFLTLRKKNVAAIWTMAAGTAVLFVAAQLAFVRFGPYMSSRRLAAAIEREVKPADKVMIYGDQAYGSSLLFYLRRRIYLVNGRTTSMWFGSTFPDAPHIFLDDEELERDWKGSSRIFLFVPPEQRERVERVLPEPYYTFAKSSGKVVYSNRR